MLEFDGACDVISIDATTPQLTDDEFSVMGCPHAVLKPEGLYVRSSCLLQKKRIVRVTQGGGFFICNGDTVVESRDLRAVLHIVPLVVSRLDVQVIQRHSQDGDFRQHGSTRIVEETEKAVLALVWSDSKTAAPQVGRRNSFHGIPRANSNQSLTSVGSSNSIRQPLRECEDSLPLNSQRRGQLLAERVMGLRFASKSDVLKFVQAADRLVRGAGRILTAPPIPKERGDVVPQAESDSAPTTVDVFDLVEEIPAATFQSKSLRIAEMDEDPLHKESTAAAQSMIERLTSMQVVLHNPFQLTMQAKFENSPSQVADAEIAAELAASTANSAQETKHLVALRRLREARHPTSCMEMLRSRKPEYTDARGLREFFLLCRELYRDERSVFAATAATCASELASGFAAFHHFTGAAVAQLFHTWVAQRKRESYRLDQYLMDLQQYYCDLQQEEMSDMDTSALVVAEGSDITTRWNPLTMYGAPSAKSRFDMVQHLHREIEGLLKRRAEREGMDSVGGSYLPLLGDAKWMSHRSMSNVFPDRVADRIYAAVKKQR